jgi:hypothetical protein
MKHIFSQRYKKTVADKWGFSTGSEQCSTQSKCITFLKVLSRSVQSYRCAWAIHKLAQCTRSNFLMHSMKGISINLMGKTGWIQDNYGWWATQWWHQAQIFKVNLFDRDINIPLYHKDVIHCATYRNIGSQRRLGKLIEGC